MHEVATGGFIVQPWDAVAVLSKAEYGVFVHNIFSRVIWDHATYSEASAISLKTRLFSLKNRLQHLRMARISEIRLLNGLSQFSPLENGPKSY